MEAVRNLQCHREFNLKNREKGEEQFKLDRTEILERTLLFVRGRLDPLLKILILTWMRDAFEHRLWPLVGSDALKCWGDWRDVPFTESCEHFKEIDGMQHFEIEEVLVYWTRLKMFLGEYENFGLTFRKFWEYVSKHFGGSLEN